MNSEDMNADEKELLKALQTLAREEEGLAAPSHVEARLLQAFDENRGAKSAHRRIFAGYYLKVAAALVVGVLGVYWWSRGDAQPPSDVEQFDPPPLMTVWPSSETLLWLDAEPESLQIVHVLCGTGQYVASIIHAACEKPKLRITALPRNEGSRVCGIDGGSSNTTSPRQRPHATNIVQHTSRWRAVPQWPADEGESDADAV